MLTKHFIQPKIFERMTRTRDGRLVRVRFAVAIIDGEVCGRILSAEPIGELVSLEFGKLVSFKKVKIRYHLPAPKKKLVIVQSRYKNGKIISPFHSLEFFMSQPTRAPSRDADL